MDRSRNALIAEMTETLEPVRAFRARDGWVLAGLAVLATAVFVELVSGFWRGALTGEASAEFWIANGLLAVLGAAAATSVVAMASPRVGNRHDAPRWGVAMVAVLPLAAIAAILGGTGAAYFAADIYGPECMISGLAAGLLVGAALTLWLRRGAPVMPEQAGWMTGLASGALGSAVYGLSCPLDDIVHIGIWHVAPVVLAAAIGRIVLPRLLRW